MKMEKKKKKKKKHVLIKSTMDRDDTFFSLFQTRFHRYQY